MNSAIDVMIYGGGMLGRQVAHLLCTHHSDKYQITGFIDDVQPPGIEIVAGITSIGSLDEVAGDPDISPEKLTMIFAIGYSDMPARRLALDKALSMGFSLTSLIHPAASVDPSAKLGAGVIVLAGAVVDQDVEIGDACYLHNGSIVGENSTIGKNNYFSAGTTLGGSVIVGADNFFGINSTIVNDIVIGSNNFVNAGSLVYKPIDDNVRIVEYREQREVRQS